MAVNVKVVAKQGESADSLIRRFTKEVKTRSYVLEEVEKRKFFRTKKERLAFKHDMLMRHLKNKKYKIKRDLSN